MRYKQEIDKRVELLKYTLDTAIQDIDSNKPHVTKQYMADVFTQLRKQVDYIDQYLLLEDE